MEGLNTVSTVFDYTSFLGDSCQKKLTLTDLLSSVAPTLGLTWGDEHDVQPLRPEERLREEALNILSAQSSDEVNIIHLLLIAKQQGIQQLHLMMPYELDATQIEAIEKETNASVSHIAPDEFMIQLA